jgi:hypothetical protein
MKKATAHPSVYVGRSPGFPMTTLSIRDMLVHGALGGARVGMRRDEVLVALGRPDMWSSEARGLEHAVIWRYGNFEVHFDGGTASMLFNDHLRALDAGPGRLLERWILEGEAPFDHETITRRLREEGVATEVGSDSLGRHTLEVPASGARLTFDDEGSAITIR